MWKIFAHFGKIIDLAVAIDSESILATFRKVSPETLQFWARVVFHHYPTYGSPAFRFTSALGTEMCAAKWLVRLGNTVRRFLNYTYHTSMKNSLSLQNKNPIFNVPKQTSQKVSFETAGSAFSNCIKWETCFFVVSHFMQFENAEPAVSNDTF